MTIQHERQPCSMQLGFLHLVWFKNVCVLHLSVVSMRVWEVAYMNYLCETWNERGNCLKTSLPTLNFMIFTHRLWIWIGLQILSGRHPDDLKKHHSGELKEWSTLHLIACNKVTPQHTCMIVIEYKVYFILGLFSRSKC